jgi:ribosomal protein L40E
MYAPPNTSLFCKVLKFLPVFIVYLAIGTIYYSYVRYYIFDKKFENEVDEKILNEVNENSFLFHLSLKKIILLITITIIVFLIFLCHYLCAFTNPGNIIDSKVSKIKNFEICLKCDSKRPPRAHHCKSCDKCILKMDHHCPWIANCVGLKNQKYFILFLFYSTLGCIITSIGMLSKFIELDEIFLNEYREKLMIDNNLKYNSYSYNETYIKVNNGTESVLNTTMTMATDKNIFFKKFENPVLDPILISLCTVVPILLLIAIGGLFIMQSYFILKNMTNIEYYKYKNKKSDFDHTAKFSNLKIVLGGNIFIWFVPVFINDENNDGYNYKFLREESNENNNNQENNQIVVDQDAEIRNLI